ncbi:MAG: hypothetical protein FWE88_01595 [Phycisphaerae bacterium]|nr:hypothetical protein [Phycisphaerae bacterium]
MSAIPPARMNESWHHDTQPIRPRAMWYWIALVMFLGGIAILVSGVAQFVRVLSQPPLARIVVPGSATVQLDAPGEYLLSYSLRAATEGVSSNQPPNTPSIQASVTDLATKQPVTLTNNNSFSLTNSDMAAISVFSFNVNTPGQYQIDIAYAETPPTTPTEILVMSQNVFQTIITFFKHMGLSLLLGLLALIIFLVTIIRRSSAKRRRLAGG